MKYYIMIPSDGWTFVCGAASKADAYDKLAKAIIVQEKKAHKKKDSIEVPTYTAALAHAKDEFSCEELKLDKATKDGVWQYL